MAVWRAARMSDADGFCSNNHWVDGTDGMDMRTYAHRHSYTYPHACKYIPILACIYTQTHTHALTNASTHACAHAHTHTHTHTFQRERESEFPLKIAWHSSAWKGSYLLRSVSLCTHTDTHSHRYSVSSLHTLTHTHICREREFTLETAWHSSAWKGSYV